VSNNSKPNIGGTMTLVHHAITRGLEQSKIRSIIFRGDGYTNEAVRNGFEIYVRTLGMAINAHHSSEDQVIFPYLKAKLPDAPFDQISAEHQQMEVLLTELQKTAEALANQDQDNATLENLNRIVTSLTALWIPHIAKEQLYINDTTLTEAVMNEEEQNKLNEDVTKHSLDQGNPALMLPFLLYNLEPEERATMASLIPAELIEEMIPNVWKSQWWPMEPFLID